MERITLEEVEELVNGKGDIFSGNLTVDLVSPLFTQYVFLCVYFMEKSDGFITITDADKCFTPVLSLRQDITYHIVETDLSLVATAESHDCKIILTFSKNA